MENFNFLRRALPSSAPGRDRLKSACTEGVGGLRLLCISVVTFVQFTSASLWVDEVGVCIIACERKAGQRRDQRGTRRDATVNEYWSRCR
jgi:hypothetical protein